MKKGEIMIIGITGGIGSGKSYIAKIMADFLSTKLISADEIVHKVTGVNGAAIGLIRAEFGNDYINQDGSLNRKKMRDLVFDNKTEKERLEKVTNPIIYNAIHNEIGRASNDYTFVVVEIPLLYESNYWKNYCDKIVVVTCNEETQIKRVQERNGFEVEQIKKIIGMQASNNERLSIATHEINNTSDEDKELRESIARIVLQFLVEKS